MRSDLRNFYCATKQQILNCSQEKHYANNKTVQEPYNTQRPQYCMLEEENLSDEVKHYTIISTI